MKIVAIHGQSHKGVTHAMARAVLECLADAQDEVTEFFLPTDGPDFCCGCNRCFLKGEAHCPSAAKVQPIARAMERADVIILVSPNYVMEMSGAMKNLMDHLAYRWVTHRPHGAMFTKVGVVLSSSAGAPPGGVVRSLAKQLKWMGASRVYGFGLVGGAMNVQTLKEEKRAQIRRRAEKIAGAIKRRLARPRPCLRGRIAFAIFRRMQAGSASAWNPTDRDWWIQQGWTKRARPWRG